jgi:glutamine---fructose-6-phosphate transaminase (isomerizing)
MTPSLTLREVSSQPQVWLQALTHTDQFRDLVAAPGERVLFVGCGTSAFVAQSLAALRDRAGLGQSDWAYASELPQGHSYDQVVALTRSGTTTEVLDAMRMLREANPDARLVGVCAVEGMPVAELADDTVVLECADEESVVQTRFPTTVLLVARAAFGEDVRPLVQACATALEQPVALDLQAYRHFVFLGRGWSLGLAHEAALKTREAAQAWAESYPALDYRHGPIAVADTQTLVFLLGENVPSLVADIEAVGATALHIAADPLVQLVHAQRLALALAEQRGLNPDSPRHLTRSVVLSAPRNTA